MDLDLTQRRRLSARAARFLRDEQADWLTSYWIVDGDQEDLGSKSTSEWARMGVAFEPMGNDVGRLRQFLRNLGFGTVNRKCGVCAEGALLLAIAEDTSIPDSENTQGLLKQFEREAAQAANDLGYLDDGEDFDDIPTLNDSGRFDDRDQVVTFLDQMSNY